MIVFGNPHRAAAAPATRRAPGGTAVLVLACSLITAFAADAHIQVLRGKLLDLVEHSDLVIIGTADRVTPIGTTKVDTTVSIARVLSGSIAQKQLLFRGPTRFAPGERYVFFLRRTPDGIVGAQDAGTVFPCTHADDAIYRSTIAALERALHGELAMRPDAVRAALLPALTANPAPLRYNAALELSALAHEGHPPTAAERTRLEKLLHDPGTDPTLEPLLTEIIKLAPPPVSPTPAKP